jgi:hypothetical protein
VLNCETTHELSYTWVFALYSLEKADHVVVVLGALQLPRDGVTRFLRYCWQQAHLVILPVLKPRAGSRKGAWAINYSANLLNSEQVL